MVDLSFAQNSVPIRPNDCNDMLIAVLDLTRSTFWPLLTAAIFFSLKSKIIELIDKIESISIGGTHVNTSKKLDETQNIIDQSDEIEKEQSSHLIVNNIEELKKFSPNNALIAIWTEFYRQISILHAKEFPHDNTLNKHLIKKIIELVKKKNGSNDLLKSVINLNKITNQVMTDPNAFFTEHDVNNAHNLCNVIFTNIKKLTQ